MSQSKKRPFIAALLLAASMHPALALDGIEAAERDLWCGLALAFVVEERPADSALDTATLDWLTTGAQALIQRGEAAYLEQGFSDAALVRERETLAGRVVHELGTVTADEPFSYEECRALFG